MTDFKRCLDRAMREAGFILNEVQLERFKLYRDELRRWNRKINLTSVSDDCGIVYRHFVDSVLPIAYGLIAPKSDLADVGTGPGFPGLCLKLVEPTLRVTLIDSSHKKTAFLKYLIARMGLEGIDVVWARAEELIRNPDYSGRFDYVTARYLAELHRAVSYCIPLLKPRGRFIAYKGEDVSGELEKALEPIRKLGARVAGVVRADRALKYRVYRSFVIIERSEDGQDTDSVIG